MERKSRWQMFVSEFTFFEICHTARGVPSSTAVCHIWIYVTRFNVTHHKVLLNQLFQKLNFPTLYDGRQNAVNRGDPISDEKDDSWDTGIVLEPELKICSKSVPSLVRKSKFWTENFQNFSLIGIDAKIGRHGLKVADTLKNGQS